jgi:uncharacterized membrane protein
MLFLSFGPLLLAAAGLLRRRWVRGEGAAAAGLTIAACIFYFFVDVPDMNGIWVGWRSGHQLLIAFAVAGGAALTSAWRVRSLRLPIVLVALLACAPAVPTVAIDVYNAQDVWNRMPGPSFPWTLVVSPREREAFEWVKRSTPRDATVQFEPIVRGSATWASITAFGERRMAAGLPSAMIPFEKFHEASSVVNVRIFESASAVEAHGVAIALGIDYLWIGEIERKAYRPAVVRIAARPDLFPQVFKNNEVTIFAVRR